MADVLAVRDLSVDFRTQRGRVHALRRVGLRVPENTIVGIVGESGSGKSTLVWAVTRLLAGNAVVEGGSIRFGETDVLALSERELRRFRGDQVSIVFQDPMTSQIPVMTYARQMADIQYRERRSAAEKRRLAIRMMRRVGIPDPETRIDQHPHHFSGGMRQRAGIAMALLMDPALLIADEATTALDVTMEAQIVHLLRELKRELDASIMVVSHNLGLIAELCDQVVVMYAGEVVERGSVHDIFHRPSHPYTQALMACDPARVLERTRTLPTIPGDVPDLHGVPAGCVFAERCPSAMEVCHSQPPRDHQIGGGHIARCHLFDTHLASASPGAAVGSDGEARPHEAPVTKGPAAPLLEVSDLRVRFRTMGRLRARVRKVEDPFVDAVLDVSLGLGAGETLGLVGESGSGKTTLGRALLGLARPHSGSVRFDGRELLGLAESDFKPLRSQMAMMFQDPVGSLSPRQTVRALLSEPFQIHGQAGGDLRSRVDGLADMVSLPTSFLGRYPHELSGGQARRVGVARALALQPRLIVADEPTAGLDVSVQGEILNLLGELQRQHGLAYLVITHNLPVIGHISDRLAIMYLGRIVELGGCEAVFARPAHPYTEALVKGVPRPDPDRRRELVSIEGEVPSLANRPPGCEFHTRCPYAQARCHTEAPVSRDLGDGRSVRCHFPLDH
jgi:peptide/nickel transport system ATP-binding protein